MLFPETLVKILTFDFLGETNECVLNHEGCISVDVTWRPAKLFKFVENLRFRPKGGAHVLIVDVEATDIIANSHID